MIEGFFEKILNNVLEWSVRKQKIPAYVTPIMKITSDHWLEAVQRQPLKGGSAMPTRRFLVIHHTCGWTAQSSIDFWNTPQARGASAHVIIDRNGEVTQIRPFNLTCGHAGVSKWLDPKPGGVMHTGLNDCSIGIELANMGDFSSYPDIYPKTMGLIAGQKINRIHEKHKFGTQVMSWEVYPDAQLKALEIVAKAICERYNIDDLVGHEDIAPDRKVDPGPAFPMQTLRNSCGFVNPLGKL